MYKFKANGIKPAPDLIAFHERYFSSYLFNKVTGCLCACLCVCVYVCAEGSS